MRVLTPLSGSLCFVAIVFYKRSDPVGVVPFLAPKLTNREHCFFQGLQAAFSSPILPYICSHILTIMPDNVATKGANTKMSFEDFKNEVLNDYRIACVSREMSLIGRKEVLTGKAKFGIFGDGKEVAQIALAKAFDAGDWRSGYYRDQTWMMALGELTVEQFFAQLYANPDQNEEPMSAGRQMNGHYVTRIQDKNGKWLEQSSKYNSSADISPTAGQMPRSLGIALASKLYRENAELEDFTIFSNKGREVSFVSIGDASTSEGLFWETLNAAGVMKVPLAISVWDDGYGISVSKKYQTTKESISEIVQGFQTDENGNGVDIYVCEGWNYAKLVETYKRGIEKMRKTHNPALFHITGLTQPQGHSTSGSHERYKSPERLQWEKDFDCIKKMRDWMIEGKIATAGECDQIQEEAKKEAGEGKSTAWRKFNAALKGEINELIEKIEAVGSEAGTDEFTGGVVREIKTAIDPVRRDMLWAGKKELVQYRGQNFATLDELRNWLKEFEAKYQEIYSSYLYSESAQNALKIPVVPAAYSDDSKVMNGFEILNHAFDHFVCKISERSGLRRGCRKDWGCEPGL